MKIVALCVVCATLAFAVGATNAASDSERVSTASIQSDVKKLKREVKQLRKTTNYVLFSKLRATTEVYADALTNGAGFAGTTARCPSGSVVTGGGGEFNVDGRQGDKLVESRPYPGGWTAAGMSYAAVAGRSFRVYAICAVR